MRAVVGVAAAFGGAATAAMGAAVGYGTMLGSMPQQCPHCENGHGGSSSGQKPAVDEALRRRAYDALAGSFDEKLEWHELLTGIKLMRWWMMRQVKGDTLEVAAGCAPPTLERRARVTNKYC